MPPDQTKATRFATSSGGSFSRLAIASVNDSVANPRVNRWRRRCLPSCRSRRRFPLDRLRPSSISRSKRRDVARAVHRQLVDADLHEKPPEPMNETLDAAPARRNRNGSFFTMRNARLFAGGLEMTGRQGVAPRSNSDREINGFARSRRRRAIVDPRAFSARRAGGERRRPAAHGAGETVGLPPSSAHRLLTTLQRQTLRAFRTGDDGVADRRSGLRRRHRFRPLARGRDAGHAVHAATDGEDRRDGEPLRASTAPMRSASPRCKAGR